MIWTWLSLIATTLAVGTVFGQTTPMLTGSGYGLPTYLTVAPGQIVTLQISGLRTVLPAPLRVTTTPLPTALSGIAVTLNQYVAPKLTLTVPILALSQRNYCSDSSTGSADCRLTFLTVQIPFEMRYSLSQTDLMGPPLPRCPAFEGHCPLTELQVWENGVASKAFMVVPVADNIHIATDCDVQALGNAAFSFAVPYEFAVSSATYLSCRSIATHADGTRISYAFPAMPSETVVLYAWGAGPTQPVVKTGDATPAAASPTWATDLQFNFSPNTPPSKPYAGIFPASFYGPRPYVGLVPGLVGLYQINVKLPDTFPNVQRCDALTEPSNYSVQSNLTITIGGINSFDGAAICVQPPQ